VAVAVVDVQVNSTGAVNQIRNVANASKAAQSSVNGLENAVRGLVGAFSAAQAVRFIFGKTAEIESQVKSLQVLTGSVQQAKQIIQELQQLGAVTPFTSTELIDAAKRLNAFGVAAKDVVDTTRRLADVSGATGAELQGLVTAYGQVQAKGRLQGEELLQFQERGVALQKELQRMYGMSGDQFREALSKGRISAEAVQVAIQNLTNAGGKYANGAIAQSDTLQGKFSTLQDAVEGLARTIGQVFAPLFKYLMDEATKVITVITDAINMAAMGPQKAKVLSEARAGRLPTSSLNPLDFFTGNTSQQKLFELLGKGNAKTGEAIFKRLAEQSREGPGFLPNLEKLGKLVSQQPGIKAAPAPAQKPGAQPPALLGETGGGQGSSKAANAAKRLAEELKRSVEQGDNMGRELSRQILLLNNITDQEEERYRIQFEYEDRLREINDLKNKEQQVNLRALNEEIRRLELQKLATEELKKQNEEFYKRAGLVAQIYGAGAGGFRTDIDLLGQQQKALDEVLKKYPQIGEAATAASQLATQGTLEMINGTKTAQQAFADFLNSIVDILMKSAAQMIAQYIAIGVARSFAGVGGLFSGAGPVQFPGSTSVGVSGFGLPNLMARAGGGSVMAGQPYLVGENGPELFMPGRSGGIAPTGSFGGMGNVVVNVDAGGSSVQGDPGQASQLGKAIGIAVQQELIKQKRPGGLLA
jgi:tape measure domain-containing protein